MFDVKFTPRGKQDLEKLPKDIQQRVIKNFNSFLFKVIPYFFSKPLVNLPPATHRFRIGDYRVAFYIELTTVYVERIRHRREVYLR